LIEAISIISKENASLKSKVEAIVTAKTSIQSSLTERETQTDSLDLVHGATQTMATESTNCSTQCSIESPKASNQSEVEIQVCNLQIAPPQIVEVFTVSNQKFSSSRSSGSQKHVGSRFSHD